jgi:LytR cell envelope-related transcriptional attenuator
MSLPPQRIDTTHDIIYHAKHPFYELALEKSALVSRDPRVPPALLQLRFTEQPRQEGIVLPLAALEQFHDALGRLIDYIKQERGREPAVYASASPMEDEMRLASEPRDHDSTADPPEASAPTATPNRPISVTSLWRLSGLILVWLIALLSWALYSLWASTGDFRPRQATAAQEGQPHMSTLAMPDSKAAADVLPARTEVAQPPPAVSSPPTQAYIPQPPHISLHIQSAGQQGAAQGLADILQQNGYNIAKTVTLVAKGPSRTEVRYFHPTEAEEAAAIAMLLHQPYRPPATLNYMRGRKDALQTSPRRYEVWLGPEPRSR